MIRERKGRGGVVDVEFSRLWFLVGRAGWRGDDDDNAGKALILSLGIFGWDGRLI